MRTEERWKTSILPKKLKYFSPRIRKDLSDIKFKALPKNIVSCFITGTVSSGKTLLACRMLLQEQKNIYLHPTEFTGNTECLFITVDDFFEELKASFSNDEDSEKIVARYAEAHLLIFDDLGTKKVSEWMLGILYLIINRRYENLKKTIITSNFSLKVIADTCDARISSRIERMGPTIDKVKR